MKIQVISLPSIAGGAACERFADAMQELLINVQDPNTDAEAKRSIRLEFEFTPSPERNRMAIKCKCTKKFASARAVKTIGYISEEKGRPIATEYNPAQQNLFEVGQDKEKLN